MLLKQTWRTSLIAILTPLETNLLAENVTRVEFGSPNPRWVVLGHPRRSSNPRWSTRAGSSWVIRAGHPTRAGLPASASVVQPSSPTRVREPAVVYPGSTRASSVSWEHTQLVRREGGRLDSTLKGMNSLEDGCSIETDFMELPWKERARRSMDAPDEVTGGDCRPLDIVWYKGVGRVDGELGKATSQLDQLERSSKPQVKWFSSTSWEEGELILHVDGSSNIGGAGVGIVLTSLTWNTASRAVRCNFKATNTGSEYEALIARLTLSHQMGAENNQVFGVSQLIINQVQGEYQQKTIA
ncbi:hypothetical protein F2Q69_00006524 [Brassica cretica]|uniref:RNase H type-1 domain-containing protein n=1 Tax=Brassica cretica TaxID=69181 RepID=A0A8S9NYG6_BRACR|nr:hypothetical protein F2Q69_00006524 [Brassica cretica]